MEDAEVSMAKSFRHVTRAGDRNPKKLPRQAAAPTRGREIFRREERLRIAPKHPGMGRR
jgi:hypothetical protein